MKAIPTVTIESGGAITSHVSLRAFLRDNEFEPEERAYICGVLRADGAYVGGGGAAPEFRVALAGFESWTDEQLLAEIERLQAIQKRNPPTSAAWREASEDLAPLFREMARRQQ